MDSKFCVSLEAARLLKEKGYNEECDCSIDDDSDIYECECRINQELPKWKWSCPTKAEAIDWLDSKGIIIELSVTHDLCHWVFSIYMKGREGILTNTDFDFESFTTRLEAQEAGIKKALELILKKGE